MKMRKKLAALLAAAMIASVMPMTVFATSDNRVTKTVNIEKDTKLTTDQGVSLVIKMKDSDVLSANEIFALKLTDAEWDKDAYGDGEKKDLGDYYVVRESGSILVVTNKNAGASLLTIPLGAKITGDAPTVEIDPIDSLVSAGKYVIANSASGKALVTVGSVPTIAGTDKMSSITFDEPFVGAFRKSDSGATTRTIELELRDSDFSFDITGATFKGTKAYFGKTEADMRVTNGVLKIELPVLNESQRGGFILEGVKVKPNRNAREGEVKVTIDGNLVDKSVVTVAKYGDFTTTLKVAKDDYSVVAGKDIDVEFTLAEEMANALIGNRTVNFAFSKDIVINTIEVKEAKELETGKGKADVQSQTKIATITRTGTGSDINTNEFSVDEFYPNVNKKSSYTFKANLLVPAGYEGDITLTAEGRGLEEKKEVVVAKTEAPVTVEAKAATVKVGLKTQATDAKIVIKETKEDRITKGKDIIVSIADRDSGLEFVDAVVKVTEGDLELDKDNIEVEDGRIIIPVKRHSTEVSTIEITDIEIKSDRTVPQGSYDVKVGGPAISDFTENPHFGDKKSNTTGSGSSEKLVSPVLDAVVAVKDFIVVGTPNTEDIAGGVNKAKVSFTVGASQYLVNAQEATMDATPYIKDGRTMVPVRYVATALGIKDDQVIWDQANQTATILADKTVQVKLGSKDMVVNGVVITMSAATELKADRTFVPVAEIARALGVPVEWDAATQTATFN